MDRTTIHGLNDPYEPENWPEQKAVTYSLDDLFYVSFLEPDGEPPYTAVIRSEVRTRNEHSVKLATLQDNDIIALTLKVHKLFNEKEEIWRTQLQSA